MTHSTGTRHLDNHINVRNELQMGIYKQGTLQTCFEVLTARRRRLSILQGFERQGSQLLSPSVVGLCIWERAVIVVTCLK